MKQYWLDAMSHVHAQGSAWFLLFCLAVVCAGIYIGIREEGYE